MVVLVGESVKLLVCWVRSFDSPGWSMFKSTWWKRFMSGRSASGPYPIKTSFTRTFHHTIIGAITNWEVPSTREATCLEETSHVSLVSLVFLERPQISHEITVFQIYSQGTPKTKASHVLRSFEPETCVGGLSLQRGHCRHLVWTGENGLYKPEVSRAWGEIDSNSLPLN